MEDNSVAQYRPLARLSVRLIMEYIVDAVPVVGRMLQLPSATTVTFMILLRAADLDGGTTGSPISINALSRSLNQPFETMRRQCNALIAAGLVERTEGGLHVTSAMLQDPRIAAILTALHDRMVRLIADLHSFDVPLPTQTGEPRIHHPAIHRAAVDLVLFSLEFGMPAYTSWNAATIYVATLVANARSFTFDPVVARRYTESLDPPPEGVRRPVSVAALARGTGLPYPTARRHVEELVAAGALEKRPDGVIVSLARLQDPEMLAVSDLCNQHTMRVLRELAPSGFPFDNPESAYIEGRPPLMPLD